MPISYAVKHDKPSSIKKFHNSASHSLYSVLDSYANAGGGKCCLEFACALCRVSIYVNLLFEV